jgi:hypothetical protein
VRRLGRDKPAGPAPVCSAIHLLFLFDRSSNRADKLAERHQSSVKWAERAIFSAGLTGADV